MAKKTSRKSARTGSTRPPVPKRAGARDSETFGTGPMSLPLLQRLVRLMAENGLTDLQLKDGDQRIILSRGGMGASAFSGGHMTISPAGATHLPLNMPSSPAATEGLAASITGSRPSDIDAAGQAGLIEIKSPMVGTFYTSPSPDAKPFVKVGDRVAPDTDVCIIEAMKVFNNIKAETSGVIQRILVDNGQAVQYGQVLFLVRPA